MLLKKSKWSMIVLLALTAALLLAVTPVGAETRNIVLWDATVKNNRGVVFTFKVYGEFNKFNGEVWSSGQSYKLNCHLSNRDDSLLICQGSGRGLDSLGNTTVQVVVNGFGFSTYVEVEKTHYCAGVYDYLLSPDNPVWWQIGTHCSNSSDNFNGVFQTENGPVGGEYKWDEGGFCGPDGSWNDFGQGWYYVSCESPV